MKWLKGLKKEIKILEVKLTNLSLPLNYNKEKYKPETHIYPDGSSPNSPKYASFLPKI